MHIVYKSDVYSGLNVLKNNTISVSITSPPYWGQRDYGFSGQIGNEITHQKYIEKLVEIFSLLKDKLNEKGIFFLNIGDKYLSKYGNTPLGMIPYKLAYSMVNDGWILDDTIIWYKPNHMPSSVKNRFTNSYEPVFVFSKNPDNYFSDYLKSDVEYKNIIKINLSPSPYKHVAVYPEKLVECLLSYVIIPDDSYILDPFAGSGTTLKVVQNINDKNKKTYSGIMIDNNEEYVNIIKSRCNLKDSNIKKIISRNNIIVPKISNSKKLKYEQLKLLDNYNYKTIINKKGIFKIFDTIEDYYNLLTIFENKSIKNYLDLDSICFIGSKEFDIELIYRTSLLNEKNWVIRNMIVIEYNDSWFPVFMVADDNKKIKYRFNYKELNLKHKNGFKENWNQKSFLGYKVKNNLTKSKNIEGIIVEVDSYYDNSFPKYVVVKWDNNTYTKEFVVYSEEEINNNLDYINNNPVLEVNERQKFTEIRNIIENYNSKYLPVKNNYSIVYEGKYKDLNRLNRGASPGARSKTEEEFFTLQRLYNVDQRIISNYLNYKRKEKGLSKSELSFLFPKNYQHTVGHWLRNDFGGSLPLPEDWLMLNKFLELDDNYTNYVCKTALRLQMVKHGEFKLPDDFLSYKNINLFRKILS